MNMNESFKGKSIIVTGAGSGIRRAALKHVLEMDKDAILPVDGGWLAV